MKLNIFFRLEKAWIGTRQKLVSSNNYWFCSREKFNLHYVKQNEKPLYVCIELVCISLNLGIGMEVTTITLLKPFLISPTYLKLAPSEANNLLFPVPGLGTILVFTQMNRLKSKKIFSLPYRCLRIHTNHSKLIEDLVSITRMCSPRQFFTSVMAQTIYEWNIYSLGGCVITKNKDHYKIES